MSNVVRIGLTEKQLRTALNALVFHDQNPVADHNKEQIDEVIIVNLTLFEERQRGKSQDSHNVQT